VAIEMLRVNEYYRQLFRVYLIVDSYSTHKSPL
jgi:hypothetical protein